MNWLRHAYIIFVPIILLTNNVLLVAQNTVLLKGSIYDIETGNPVNGVNIYNINLRNGATTAASGAYSIRVNEGDTLVFSHVGYVKQQQVITSGVFTMDVAFEPSVTILPAAEVRPVVKISYGMMLDVGDYAFIGDSILYYGYCYRYDKNRNPWLVLVNGQGDTVATFCAGADGRLFRDCMGNLHFLTAATAFQLSFDTDSIVLLYPSPKKEFLEIVQPCIIQSGSKFLFSEYSDRNQILMYYYADTLSQSYEMLRTIVDEVKHEMFVFHGVFLSMGNCNGPSDADLRFEDMMFDSVFAPAIKLRDTIALINYTDSVIEWYNNDFHFLGKVGIQFQNNRYIENQILTDEVTGNVYAVYLKNGKTKLRQIYIHSGTLGKEISIPDFAWVGNLKVHNGQLYFLYREKFTGDFQALYKMGLQ
ncbi:MAG: carboxypeptidase-like regulatory domain-containing protein [Bacteroidales bacterium]|nr:carboxypeptidase-like regulatory domain-containing protein [Bacteroidales bacterium]HOY38127.1 carboxypeptidase-like regulatory domain-containing protein [Bacteroidales bacterium]HQP03749.1 carboxypeptidase-like regulatory domain-containing protein [Bacteroidales bacterium]